MLAMVLISFGVFFVAYEIAMLSFFKITHRPNYGPSFVFGIGAAFVTWGILLWST